MSWLSQSQSLCSAEIIVHIATKQSKPSERQAKRPLLKRYYSREVVPVSICLLYSQSLFSILNCNGLFILCLYLINNPLHICINLNNQASWEEREYLLDQTGSQSVPSIWLKGKFVGGCNDGPEDWMGIKKIIKAGKLEEYLK